MQKQQMDDNANKVHEKNKIKTVSLSFNRTFFQIKTIKAYTNLERRQRNWKSLGR